MIKCLKKENEIMKKDYINPVISIIDITEDVIKTSGEVSWWPTKGAAGGPEDKK